MSVFFGSAVHVPAKDPVKVTDIAVAAGGGDGADAVIALAQQIAGDADAVIIQVFHSRHIDLRPEKSAELSFAHMKAACQLRDGGAIAVIGSEILQDFLGEGALFISTPLIKGRGRGRGLAEKVPDSQQI